MQRDTRNLSVAREHLGTALEEITRAQGQAERSMAQASANQAMSHMDLVVRRLETERPQSAKTDIGPAVERGYNAARRGWQSLHDALNNWPDATALSLDSVRTDLQEAITALEEACGIAPGEAIHA